MNSPLVAEQARTLTHLPEFATLADDTARVQWLYARIYQRLPTGPEVKLALAYLHENPETQPQLAQPASGAGLDYAALRKEVKVMPVVGQVKDKNVKTMPAVGQIKGQVVKTTPAAGQIKGQIKNTGDRGPYRQRQPLDAWTRYAHALFQANETMFVN
jgi:hypothetical protein